VRGHIDLQAGIDSPEAQELKRVVAALPREE